MAKKMKLMPLFQELRGRADISNRRPDNTATGIYLMKLREQSGATALPRRRLSISITPAAKGSLPHPVKINHVSSNAVSPSPGDRPDREVTDRVPQVRPGAA